MSVLQKKIRNFLDEKRDLDHQYQLVVKSAPEADENVAGLRDLYEFDQLCYLYLALKSYYDISRINWDLDYRNLLDDLANIVLRMEAKIPVTDILSLTPHLNVVRRQLRENAREGGKVAFSMVLLSLEMERFRDMVMALDVTHIDVDLRPEGARSIEKAPEIGRATKADNLQNIASSHVATPASATPASKIQTPASAQSETRPTVFVRSGTLPSRVGVSTNSHQLHSNQSTPDSSRILSTQAQKNAIPPNLTQKAPVTPIPVQKEALTPGSSQLAGLSPAFGQKRPLPSSAGLSPPKRQKQVFFAHFNTWSEEYVETIYRCATLYPHMVSDSIREAFWVKYGLKLSTEAAHALALHYGILPETMPKYRYYIQTFHSVASQFYKNRHKYVTEPWAELKRLFSRKTDLILSDDDVKGRYELFVLHRQTFGDRGEPPSNYEGHWEAFHKVYMFRKSQKASEASFFASAHSEAANPPRVYSPTPSQKASTPVEWSPKAIEALVRVQAEVHNEAPDRITVVQSRLEAEGYRIPLRDLIDKLGTTDVMRAVLELRRKMRSTAPVTPNETDKIKNGLKNLEKLAAQISSALTAEKEKLVSENRELVLETPTPAKTQTSNQAPMKTPDTSAKGPPLHSKPSIANQTYPKSTEKSTPVSKPKATPKKQTEDLPAGVKKTTAAPAQPNHFEAFMEKIARETRIDGYYRVRFKNLSESAFWDFDKHRTITATVEHISQIPEDTRNPTEKVARANLLKLLRLRFLRLYQIMISEEYLEQKLIKMMKEEVFDARACQLINDQIAKK